METTQRHRVVPVNDLKRQYASIRAEVDGAIREVFERGQFILGPAGEKFEQEFAAYCGVTHAVGVASGTEAIQLALLASGVKPGDEVITVANTAVPTIAAIRAAQGIPVFVDVDPRYYTLDASRVEAAITPRTRVILPVHLYGQCADMDPLLDIAGARGLTVVEDACQAHGALYKGRHAGSAGRLSCFSFYPTKNLGGYGDGGMVLTNDDAAAARLRLLRNYGQTKRSSHALEGINSRLDEIQASILSAKLKHLDAWNARRRALAERYSQALAGLPLEVPLEAAYGQHAFHLYVVRVAHRDAFREFLSANGVETLIHYPTPIYRQEAYTTFTPRIAQDVTEGLAREIVTLPLFPELEEDEVDHVADVIRRGFAQRAY